METPYLNDIGNTATGVGRNVQFVRDTASTVSVQWGVHAGGTWYAGEGMPFAAVTGLQQITNQHRIVSAAMYVQPEVSMMNNSGEYCLFVSPFAVENSPIYADYLNSYKAIAVPLSAANNAAVIRWFPTSRQDWSFKSFIRTDALDLDYDDVTQASAPYWGFGMLTNCPASVNFRVTVVVNYEFIPADNVLNVLDASPSPQDTMEVDLVERWTQDMPVAKPVSPTVASSSPSSVRPEVGENDEGTGFGMFFNVIKELAPLAMALLI